MNKKKKKIVKVGPAGGPCDEYCAFIAVIDTGWKLISESRDVEYK